MYTNLQTYPIKNLHSFAQAHSFVVDDGFSLADLIKNQKELSEFLFKDKNPDRELSFCKQIHSNKVINWYVVPDSLIEADGIYAKTQNQLCSILTADCLPVFLSCSAPKQVAVVHCGWKGLFEGIIFEVLKNFSNLKEVKASFGPAICAECYEVGNELFDLFCEKNKNYQTAFSMKKKYHLDLIKIAQIQLYSYGVKKENIATTNNFCTFHSSNSNLKLPSHRKNQTLHRILNTIYFNSK